LSLPRKDKQSKKRTITMADKPTTVTALAQGDALASVLSPTVDALTASLASTTMQAGGGGGGGGGGSSSNPLLNPNYSSDIPFTHPEMSSCIPPSILQALTMNMQFRNPSAVQRKAIPKVHAGKNLIIQSQTGTGKTVCFTIGMLQHIDVAVDAVQSICMAPTRELARQIYRDAVLPLSQHMSPKPKCLLLLPGDASDGTQRPKGNTIRDHLIVGTPGIFVTALKEGLNLDKLKVFVLDEADHVSTSTSISTSIRTIIPHLTIDSIVY